jgi:quercetin dioxygenase-like cupin family protein
MPSGVSYARAAHIVHPERVEAIDVLGPTIQFLTSPEDQGAPCIMRGTIPPGVSIPLHSHADPETFFMIAGTVEGLIHTGADFEWVRVYPGDIFHVPGNAKHAWRNVDRDPAEMILVTTSKLGRFLQELGKPAVPGRPVAPPSEAEVRRSLQTSEKYGYWNGSPEDNAQVGISLPPF